MTENESETLEYKESIAEKKEAGKTLSAFANKQGGIIYFGVKDDGSPKGISVIKEKTLRELSQYFTENTRPKLFPTIEKKVKNGKQIIKVSVEKSSTPYHTFKDVPYIRVGPSTKKMSQDEYHRRLVDYKSTNKDYSSTLIPGSNIDDVSGEALAELRKLLKESGRYTVDIDKLSTSQLLKDLLLSRNGQLTVAALVLLGKEESLSKHLPYGEIRFGYKTSESEIHNQDMKIFKGGYLSNYQKVWEKIDSRNLTINIPYKMRLLDKKAFDANSLREAVNNAITHRDYLISGSTFIMQYPTKIVIKSPGGFPEGVTPENVINESKPRNKLIADILFKCELVEQFGNGVNLMFKNQLSLGKSPPSYFGTDENNVELTLDGKIQDIEFAKYVLRVAEEKEKKLNDEELIILNRINNKQKIKNNELATSKLADLGLIEQVGYGKFILSKRYYEDSGKQWEYTKRKGFSKNKNKELIIQHLREFNQARKLDFANLFEFSLTAKQLSSLLKKLQDEKKIYFDGPQRSKKAYWKLVSQK